MLLRSLGIVINLCISISQLVLVYFICLFVQSWIDLENPKCSGSNRPQNNGLKQANKQTKTNITTTQVLSTDLPGHTVCNWHLVWCQMDGWMDEGLHALLLLLQFWSSSPLHTVAHHHTQFKVISFNQETIAIHCTPFSNWMYPSRCTSVSRRSEQKGKRKL